MSVSAGRVVCPRCGANNFDTQAACWKCGAVLGASAAPAAPPPPPPAGAAAPSPTPAGSSGPARSPAVATGQRPSAASAPPPPHRPAAAAAPAMAVPRPVPGVDPMVAAWSAAILGLLFPWFALPAGIIFLMLDDRRKIDVGKIAIIWGIVGTIIHTLITGWMFYAALSQLNPLNPNSPLMRMRQQQAAQAQMPSSQPQPKLTDEVPPLELPGFPRIGR